MLIKEKVIYYMTKQKLRIGHGLQNSSTRVIMFSLLCALLTKVFFYNKLSLMYRIFFRYIFLLSILQLTFDFIISGLGSDFTLS